MDIDHLTDSVIGSAIEVHRALGPGLLESAYEMCLCRELGSRSDFIRAAETNPNRIQRDKARLRISCGSSGRWALAYRDQVCRCNRGDSRSTITWLFEAWPLADRITHQFQCSAVEVRNSAPCFQSEGGDQFMISVRSVISAVNP